jgi:hypothetical protein
MLPRGRSLPLRDGPDEHMKTQLLRADEICSGQEIRRQLVTSRGPDQLTFEIGM